MMEGHQDRDRAGSVMNSANVGERFAAALRPGRLGQLRVPAIERKPNRKPPLPVTPCHGSSGNGVMPTTRDTLQTDYEWLTFVFAQRTPRRRSS